MYGVACKMVFLLVYRYSSHVKSRYLKMRKSGMRHKDYLTIDLKTPYNLYGTCSCFFGRMGHHPRAIR